MDVVNAIGRRKTSVARLYAKPGKGKIIINSRDYDEYFPSDILQTIIKQPLDLLNAAGSYDLSINVVGGGLKGQAEAIRLAIARALCEFDAAHRAPRKKEGWLTRDPRMVERKKYGRRKARKKFQFSKR